MAKSKKRQALQQEKEQKVAARLAEYAPVDRRARRKESHRRSVEWAARLRKANQGLQPTTKAARASLAHDRKREREEARRQHPVVITQGCTCPRLCDVHPR